MLEPVNRLVKKVKSPGFVVGNRVLAIRTKEIVSQEAHPIREVLIYLLVVIDRLVGGRG